MLRRNDKMKLVEDIKVLIDSYRTVAVLDMAKMPARQFLKIKNAVTADGDIKIKMTRKGLLARALKESSKPGVGELVEKMKDSPALMFSNSDPFRVFATLKKNRATSAAKVGQIVNKDVSIPKGPTQIPPGPAISTLGKIGLKTRVEGGKIAVLDERVVLKAGQPVTGDLAAVFSLLKIEPVEVGIKVAAAWENGMIYGSDILDVDVEQYLRNIESAVRQAVNFSLNTGYITSLTAPLAIQLAFWRAKSLAIAANISDKEVIGEALSKAVAEAKALEAPAKTAEQSQPTS